MDGFLLAAGKAGGRVGAHLDRSPVPLRSLGVSSHFHSGLGLRSGVSGGDTWRLAALGSEVQLMGVGAGI